MHQVFRAANCLEKLFFYQGRNIYCPYIHAKIYIIRVLTLIWNSEKMFIDMYYRLSSYDLNHWKCLSAPTRYSHWRKLIGCIFYNGKHLLRWIHIYTSEGLWILDCVIDVYFFLNLLTLRFICQKKKTMCFISCLHMFSCPHCICHCSRLGDREPTIHICIN